MASKEHRDKTLVTGFWMSGITDFQGLAPPNPVGIVANRVAELVITNVNKSFELDPPLELNDDMGVAWIPDVAANTEISTLDDRGLITLIRPNEQTSLRVKSRLEEFQRANANSKEDSVAKLRDELMGQIGPLITKVNLQGKEIDQLKTLNAELKLSNAELKLSNAELKLSNAELKSSNAELKSSNSSLLTRGDLQEEEIVRLKASNTELAATLAQHAKAIGSLRRRIVLDDARKKLTDNYPNQATFRSGGASFNNFVNQLHKALSHEDSILLSLEALQAIFDSSNNTIRFQGNVAAHEAQQTDLAFSVLSVDVKGKQRELLVAIYKYAYSDDPKLLVDA